MLNEKIREIALRVCKDQGFNLYNIEFKNTDKGRVLRVFITGSNGVTLDNCSSVSRQLNSELDVVDLISSRYFLEVSSPGLERYLNNDYQYRQAIGEMVKITYRQDTKVQTKKGILREVSSTGLIITGEDQTNTAEEEIPYNTIKKVRTVLIMNQKPRR